MFSSLFYLMLGIDKITREGSSRPGFFRGVATGTKFQVKNNLIFV